MSADPKKLLSTKDAAKLVGRSSDYVARLARDGKISAKRVGRAWAIDKDSLLAHFDIQQAHKEVQKEKLVSERKQEYRDAHKPQVIVREKLSYVVSRIPVEGFVSLALAATVAFGGYSLVHATGLAQLPGKVLAEVHAAAQATHRNFDRIVRSPRVVKEESYVVSVPEKKGDSEFTNIFALALRSFEEGAQWEVEEKKPLREESSYVAFGKSPWELYQDFGYAVVDASHAVAQGYIDFVTGLGYESFYIAKGVWGIAQSISDASVGAYVAGVTTIGDVGRAIPNVYTDAVYGFVEASHEGGKVIAMLPYRLGSQMVETGSVVPNTAQKVGSEVRVASPVIGKGIVDGYVGFIYGFVDTSYELAGIYAAAVEGAGQQIGGAYATVRFEVPQRVWAAVIEAYDVVVEETVSSIEYAGARLASEYIVPVVRGVGEVENKFVAETVAGSKKVADAVEGAGKTLDAVVADAAEVAQANVATSFVDRIRSGISRLFGGGSKPVLLVNPGPAQTQVVIEEDEPVYAPTNVVQNYYATTDVNRNYVDSSITSLHAALSAEIQKLTGANRQQIVQNINTTHILNRLDNINGTVVEDGEFLDGIIRRSEITDSTFVGSSVQSDAFTGGTANFATTTLSNLTVTGDTNFNGTLTVAGLATTGALTAPYFTATSTFATTTFAGSFAVDTDGLVYATSTGNVGIGVLSPGAVLALQNSTSTQPIATFSDDGGSELFRFTNGGLFGIGTTSPYEALSVDGNGVFTGGITAATGTLTDLTVTNATTTNASSTNLFSSNATITSLLGTNATITAATSTNFYTNVLNAVTGAFTNVTATNGTTTNATSTNLAVSSLTSGRVPFVTTGGRLIDDADFTFDGSQLTLTNLFAGEATTTNATTTNLSISGSLNLAGLTASRGLFVDANNNVVASAASSVLANSITDETGSGSLVFSASPTFTGTANFVNYDATNGTTTNATSTNLAVSGSISVPSDSFGANEIEDIYLLNTGDTATGDYNFDSNTLFVDSADNRVGIGTNNPLKGLTVLQGGASNLTNAFGDGLLFSTNSGSGARIFLENQGGAVNEKSLALVNENVGGEGVAYFGSLSDDGSSWVNNYILALNLATGNVGIGTSTPYAKLSVAGEVVAEYFTATSTSVASTFPLLSSTSATSTQLAVSSLTQNRVPYVGSGGRLIDSSNLTFNGSNLTSLTFEAQSTTATSTFAGGLAVDTDGLVYDWQTSRVGVGTATPTQTLSVWGNVEIGDGASDNSLLAYNAARTSYGQLDLYNGATGNVTLTTTFGSGDIILTPGVNGNVGTGTTSPWGEFSIEGQGSAPAFVVSDSSNNTDFIIDASGEVGIGTTTPNSKLTIDTTSDGDGISFASSGVLVGTIAKGVTNGASVGLAIDSAVTGRVLGIGGLVASNIAIGAAGGDVGIGTTTPEYLLDVDGDFRVGVAGDSNALFVNTANGRVGIGTNNPSSVLDIQATEPLIEYNRAGAYRWAAGVGAGTDIPQSYFGIYDASADKVRLVIAHTTGNVGIGTTSPYAKLSVAGETVSEYFTATSTSVASTFPLANFTSATSTDFYTTNFGINNEYISDLTGNGLSISNGQLNVATTSLASGFFLQDGNSFGETAVLGTNDSNDLQFETGGSTRVAIDTSGNVGIGTTSPQETLHIYDGFSGTISHTESSQLLIENGSHAGLAFLTPNTSYNSIYFDDADGNGGYIRYQHDDNSLRFRIAGSERITVDSVGDFGIGSTTPILPLSVGSARTYRGLTSNILLTGGAQGIQFNTVGSDTSSAISAFNGALNFYNTDNIGASWDSSELTLTLASDNTVGVGTSSPWAQLSVEGQGGRPGFVVADSSNNTDFVVTEAGYVGIGTSSPSEPLHIEVNSSNLEGIQFDNISAGASASAFLGLNTEGGSDTFIRLENNDNTWTLGVDNSESDLFAISDASTIGSGQRFVINTSGYVGIGTSSPTDTLTVEGAGTSEIARFTDSSGATSLVLEEDGTVAFGINTPNATYYQFAAPDNTTSVVFSDLNGNFRHTFGTDSNTDPYWRSFNGTDLNFGIDSTNIVTVASTSNEYRVGVGTSTPWARFSVVNEYSGTPSFVVADVAGDTTPFLIDDAGSVGIGTTTPTEVLTVQGSGNSTQGILVANYGTSDFASPGVLFRGADGNGESALRLYNSNQSIFPSELQLHSLADNGLNFRIKNSGNPSIRFTVNNTDEAVRITNDGNVGIGTTTPWGKLSVTNTGSGPSFIVEDATSPDSTPFIVDAGGKVGIGTASPFANLNAYGSGTGASVASSGSTDATTYFRVARAGGAAAVDVGIVDSGTAYIQPRNQTNFATNFSLALNPNGGNVGVGVVDPAGKLEVNGGGSAVTTIIESGLDTADARLEIGETASSLGYINFDGTNNRLEFGTEVTSSETEAFFIARGSANTIFNGNVGIGTTDPLTPLEINTTNKLGATFTGTTHGEGLRVTQTDYVAGNYVSLLEGAWDDGGGDFPNVRIGAMYDGGGSNLAFGTSNNYGSGVTNLALWINSLGKISVGTTSEVAQFGVAAGATTDTYRSTIFAENSNQEANLTLSGTNTGYLNAAVTLVAEQGTGNRGLGIITYDEGASRGWFYGRGYGGGNNDSDEFVINRRSTAGYSTDIADPDDGDVENFLTITDAGDFGVGVRAPQAKFSIEQNANSQFGGLQIGDASASDYWNIYSDTNALLFNSNTNDRVAITRSGDVGIGTTSPQARVHVSNGFSRLPVLAADLAVEDDTNAVINILSGTDNLGAVYFGDPDAAATGRVEYDHSDDSLRLFAGGEKLSILSSGNVGIGSTTPSANLAVTGSLYSAAVRLGATGTSAYFDQGLWYDSGAANAWLDANVPIVLNPGGQSVGVGTTSPSGRFAVEGGESNDWIRFRSGTTDDFTVNINGSPLYFAERLAVSTTSSFGGYELTADAGSGGRFASFYTSDDAGKYFSFEYDAGNNVTIFDTTGVSGGGYEFRVNSEPLFISTIGKRFGINLAEEAINYRLHVASTSGQGYFAIGEDTEDDIFVIDSGGDVGIGNATPSALLDLEFSGNDKTGLKIIQTSGYPVEGEAAIYVDVQGYTGQFRDLIDLQSAGTSRFSVRADGKVAVGTTTDLRQFTVSRGVGNDNNAYFDFADSGYPRVGTDFGSGAFIELYDGSSGDLTIQTNFSGGDIHILPGSSGRVGINTETTLARLHVEEPGTGRYITATQGGNYRFSLGVDAGTADPYLQGENGRDLRFGTKNGGLFVNLTDEGYVGIGTETTPTVTLDVGTSSDTTVFRIADSDGACTYNPESGSVTVSCSSDERLKTNITAPAESGLSYLSDFQIKDYTVIASGETRTGVIAQEVLTTRPEMVSIAADGYYQVEEPNIWKVAQAIQELDARTEALVSVDGKIGMGTSSPEYDVHVIGDVAATSFVNISTREAKKGITYLDEERKEDVLDTLKTIQIAEYRYEYESDSNPLRLGLIAEEAPQEVLSVSGKGVDVYKLATFTLASVQELATRVESLEERVAALEAAGVVPGSGGVFSTSTLQSAFSELGVLIEKGFAQFDKLAFRQLIAEKDNDGQGAAGTGTIYSGNKLTLVENKQIKASSKVFVTFTSPVVGSWFITDKANGSFRVTLDQAQGSDVTFDYFIVQTERDVDPTSASGVVDTEAPEIQLIGANPFYISVGTDFVEPGVVVTDNVDEDLQYELFVNGYAAEEQPLDTSVAGENILTYKVLDTAGNLTTVTRAVIVGSGASLGSTNSGTSTPETTIGTSTPDVVVEEEQVVEEEEVVEEPVDSVAPQITLSGKAALKISVGDSFVDAGATATDDVDGSLTDSIVVSGTVDTAAPGTYTLTYSVADAAGNEASVSRIVTVEEVVEEEQVAPEETVVE